MIDILSVTKKPVIKFLVIAAILLCLSLPAEAGAQSMLQSSGSSLQQPGGQAQQTNNSQAQTDSPQISGNQSVLDDQNVQSLGVVSDPQQSDPDAVVEVDSELRSNSHSLPQTDNGQTSTRLIIGFVAAFVVVIFIAYRFSKFDFDEDQDGADESHDHGQAAEQSKDQTSKPSKTKKSKKKRRKPHQR